MIDDGPTPGAPVAGRQGRSRPRSWTWSSAWPPIVVAVAALLCFGWRLADEPHFVDESAMISQSYFADLLIRGDRDNPAWLDYFGYDSSPLPKYLIGLAFRVGGFRRPGPADAHRWFDDITRRFDPPGALVLARWPFAVGGVLGCVAIYALGAQARDRKVGLLAAFLLMTNPLYRLHARRAMADVLVEAFLLAALATLLWAWRRGLLGRWGVADAAASALAGVFAALSALAKLNGLLTLLIVAAWAVLAMVVPRVPIRRRLAFAPSAIIAAVVAFATFVALNPFLTARPKGPLPAGLAEIDRLGFWSRARWLVVHRTKVASQQLDMFPRYRLDTPMDKVRVAAVQGFGRFGAFGPRAYDALASTRRYEWSQDWGALIWLPWVASGLAWALTRGARQARSGVPPTAWAIAVQAIVAALVVTAYLPLAWDRYLLPLQPGSALLASGVAVAASGRIGRALRPSIKAEVAWLLRLLRRPEPWVFTLLLGSYAYFWHSRDWNSASRLMLTYAMVDRGTIVLDGLDDQTGDKAVFRGHYYTDKLPGFSLLATAPYALYRLASGRPGHPLNRHGFAYWPADYWVTLGTSGVTSALIGLLLCGLARDLGCGPRRSALVALSYGLATPAYAYATMSFGYQPLAFALLASFALLWRTGRPYEALRMTASGFLAAAASVIDLAVGPVSAILGLYLVAQAIGRRRPPWSLLAFAAGALVPTLVLLGYNQLAFGSPWEMGYFHLVTAEFAAVHNAGNPLGLMHPDWSKALPLLWGGYRGLLFYAPVVILSVPGWFVLAARRLWGMAIVSALIVATIFLVNLSYPVWHGGWSTGPRLLVPLLPFAMLPVAALLTLKGLPGTLSTLAALVLTLAGGVLILLFQGAGARLPQFIEEPLFEAVWPMWAGAPLPSWASNGRFARNLFGEAFPELVLSLPPDRQWIQFLPLVAFQSLGIVVLCLAARPGPARPVPGVSGESGPRPIAGDGGTSTIG